MEDAAQYPLMRCAASIVHVNSTLTACANSDRLKWASSHNPVQWVQPRNARGAHWHLLPADLGTEIGCR